MFLLKLIHIKSTLKQALDYIENPDKTDGKMLVSSFGCSYETADSFVGKVDSGEEPTESISHFRQIGADVKSFAV